MENFDIDIDKEISENIDIDKISNRLEFGISNRATLENKKNISKFDEINVFLWKTRRISHD